MRRLLSVLLALAITLCYLPCGAAEASPQTPFSQDAAPTLLDTGRGYIAYSFYASAIYYSSDGVTWTDLSDRQWVRDARVYIALTSPMAHREFQLIWTGTEYMMRQALRDDPRSTHQRYGDSPRNSVVTLLDEDFQIIGQRAFDGPVTDIRYEDGVYYATTNGGETAFTREEWAAEAAATFSDVPADAWYAQGVELCAEKGIMVGTGEGKFSPDRELTQAECLTLAFRLYDLIQGREHTIEHAPEDWGRMTLTLADGMVYEGYGYLGEEENRTFTWWEWRNGVKGVCAQVPGWSYDGDIAAAAQAQRTWMDAHPDICGHNAPATLTLNGVTYQGTAMCWMPVGPYVFMFLPEPDQAEEVNTLLHHAIYREAGSDRWWQDVYYTIVQRELEDIFDPYEFQDNFATRLFFARALAKAVGELPALRQVELPDMSREEAPEVYALYESGILTGTDEFRTFDAEGTLTRAQAAVMVARVLDESLRVSAPLSTPEKN